MADKDDPKPCASSPALSSDNSTEDDNDRPGKTDSTEDDPTQPGKTDSTEDDSTQPRKPRGFCDLPQEIRNRILVAACKAREWCSRDNPAGHSDACTKTTTTLALVCKDFYRQALPLLYTSVRLPWPSSLAAFQRTLAARPALGTLVRRLHIGPDEESPSDWWPLKDMNRLRGEAYDEAFSHDPWLLKSLRRQPVEPCMFVSLVDSYRAPRPPRWFFRDASISLEVKPTQDVWQAASEALAAGVRDLDVDLWKGGFAQSGTNIGSDAWHVRVLELQAAMELWCLKASYGEGGQERVGLSHLELEQKLKHGLDEQLEQQLEEEREWHQRPGNWPSSYPLLVIGDAAHSPAPEGREVFRVARSQIYKRLGRRGAPTDHFNHPLLFARSGLRWRANEGFRAQRLHQGGSVRREVEEGDDIADAFSWPTTPLEDQDANVVHPPPELCDPLDMDIPRTLTLGGNLFLARSVLSPTPQVHALSLTGFLQRALAGSRPPCHQELCFVNLGPPPPGWSAPLHLYHSALRSVKRLRICGWPLVQSEIDALTGKDGALASLREFQWIPMPEYWDNRYHDEIARSIKGLLELDMPVVRSQDASSAGDASRKRSRDDDENDDKAASADEHARSLHLMVRLDPSTRNHLLRVASTKEIAAAWDKNDRAPGQRHDFWILKFHATNSRGVPCPVKSTEGLYSDGRFEWERRCRYRLRRGLAL